MKRIHGSCLCNKIQFEVELPPICLNHCHCSRCRKASGGAFGTFLHTRLRHFGWTAGEELVLPFQPSEGGARPFCKNCGSRVPMVNEKEDHVIIPAGLLEEDPEVRPIAHLYAHSKAPWHEIRDEISQFSEDAPDAFWDKCLQDFNALRSAP